MQSIAVLITCFNRIETTKSSLEHLSAVDLPKSYKQKTYLVDDGSNDGTSRMVSENYSEVQIIQGSGDLFWCGGMYLAFNEAIKDEHDYFLWLNNDTLLYKDAILRLLRISKQFNDRAIIVGSTCDPDTGKLTYGGYRRKFIFKPLNFSAVEPNNTPIRIETMNGNCVLLPNYVVKLVGNLDPVFKHGIADFDYGLRAFKKGLEIFLAPGYYGTCLRDNRDDLNISFNERWKKLISPFGHPPREREIFAKRYAGIFWPIFWVTPYLKEFLSIFKKNK